MWGSSSAPTRRSSVKLTCWLCDSEHIEWPGSAAPLLCWRSPAVSLLRALASGLSGKSLHLSGGGWPFHFSATGGCEYNTGAVHTESRLVRWWGWEGKNREGYRDHLQAAPISLAHDFWDSLSKSDHLPKSNTDPRKQEAFSTSTVHWRSTTEERLKKDPRGTPEPKEDGYHCLSFRT